MSLAQKYDLSLFSDTPLAELARAKTIDDIERATAVMPQVKIETFHHLFDGIYIRETKLPGGSFCVGAKQKTRHLNIMLTGAVTLTNPDGSSVYLEAPLMMMMEPGQKAGIIHEDTVWQNIYPNPDNETDIQKLEDRFIERSDFIKEAYKKADLLLEHEPDNDYQDLLNEMGLTDKDVWDDMAKFPVSPMPFGSYPIMVGDSKIHGRGVLATANISAGTLLPARLSGKKTPVGRYTNHSKNPNCRPVSISGDLYFETLNDVSCGKGGRCGEELTVNYREVLCLQQ